VQLGYLVLQATVFVVEGQTARKGVYAVKGERDGQLFVDPALAAGGHVVTEGRALEVEIRQAAGQPVRPEVVADDELKLMALNSLVRTEDQRAIPMLDKILKGTGPPKLKERALFVLAQNGSPQARQMVTDIAKGGGNPDLQAKAVNYLGVFGGVESRQTLVEIYKTSTSIEVKRSIIRGPAGEVNVEKYLFSLLVEVYCAAKMRAFPLYLSNS